MMTLSNAADWNMGGALYYSDALIIAMKVRGPKQAFKDFSTAFGTSHIDFPLKSLLTILDGKGRFHGIPDTQLDSAIKEFLK